MGANKAGPAHAPGVRRWIVVFCACLVLSAGIPIGYSTWLVVSYARHSCQALNLINDNRPPHPTQGQRNFYTALTLWAREDGC